MNHPQWTDEITAIEAAIMAENEGLQDEWPYNELNFTAESIYEIIEPLT